MSAWRRICLEGWQASRRMVKRRVLALASWPANRKMKMFPRTADGERVEFGDVPPRSLAPTMRSICFFLVL